MLTDALIEDNVIYNNGRNGINADGLQSSTIENNLIYNYPSFGICLYQIDACKAQPKQHHREQHYRCWQSTGAPAAIRILDGSTGNTILNNILLGGRRDHVRISS